LSINWKKVKKAEVIEMFEELKKTYDLTFLLAMERMVSVRMQEISGNTLHHITDMEKQTTKALLNRPGIEAMEVKCKCCNGTGNYIVRPEEACFPCYMGTIIGHDGMQTIVDQVGQDGFFAHLNRQEERLQAMEDQQPRPDDMRCGDCAAPMPKGKCVPCENKIPA
jgi:hypothetical protein